MNSLTSVRSIRAREVLHTPQDTDGYRYCLSGGGEAYHLKVPYEPHSTDKHCGSKEHAEVGSALQTSSMHSTM